MTGTKIASQISTLINPRTPLPRYDEVLPHTAIATDSWSHILSGATPSNAYFRPILHLQLLFWFV